MNRSSAEEKRGDNYKLLKRSLGFVLSVAAVHDERIIEDMEGWAGSGVEEWKAIVESNLGKSRFRKAHPVEAERIKAVLGQP